MNDRVSGEHNEHIIGKFFITESKSYCANYVVVTQQNSALLQEEVVLNRFQDYIILAL